MIRHQTSSFAQKEFPRAAAGTAVIQFVCCGLAFAGYNVSLPAFVDDMSRARKIRAHSRILRLEREILRPENLVQSQLCA